MLNTSSVFRYATNFNISSLNCIIDLLKDDLLAAKNLIFIFKASLGDDEPYRHIKYEYHVKYVGKCYSYPEVRHVFMTNQYKVRIEKENK